jgi:hypothetical protein
MVVFTLSLAVELCEGGDVVIVSVSVSVSMSMSIYRAVRRRRDAGIYRYANPDVIKITRLLRR